MNDKKDRFQDLHLRLSDLDKEVWVCCPQCDKRAIAQVDHEKKKARLFCENCGYNKDRSTQVDNNGQKYHCKAAAHQYFEAKLWLESPFKQEIFYAYNGEHLHYLEQYISAKIREHKDRKHFTLLEKLPRFYHEAKNRAALLKTIDKLKLK